MQKRARIFLQAMIQKALATVHTLAQVWAAGLLPYLTTVYGVDRTGCGLPASLQDRLPGSGGSATTAGAHRHPVWDSNRRRGDHCALTAWNRPEKKDVDTVGAFAHQGLGLLWAGGYCQVQAVAPLAPASAYVFSRLKPQTHSYEPVAGPVRPRARVPCLHAVKGNRAEQASVMGAKAQGTSRLLVSRVPALRGHERRSKARKNAQKPGETPSQAPRPLCAWPLFMTNVPQTLWTTATLVQVSP